MKELPDNAIHLRTRKVWRAWLARHHERPHGVWLVSFKRETGKPRIEYNDAVEEALAFGWIDSRPAKLDAERSMLYFSPRRPGSAWSQLNKQRVQRLLAAGLMAPAGLAKVEAAQRDGSWKRLDGVDSLEVPADLQAALSACPPAELHWEGFPRSVKRGILEWVGNAKRPDTRRARVAETATLAARNIRANQWKRPKTP